MAAPGKKSFCVLEYHTSKSVVTVQRAFRAPILTRVWQEFEYRIDVCRVTLGAHIEHLWLQKKKILWL